MKRLHAALISLLLGAATIAGVIALTHTVRLGPSAPNASQAIAVRQAQLDQVAAQIRRLRRANPPAPVAARRKQTASEQVIYVRASAPATSFTGERGDENDGRGTTEGGGFDD